MPQWAQLTIRDQPKASPSAVPAGTPTVPSPTNSEEARAYIAALSDLGMLSVADTDAVGDGRFPQGGGYRYVLVGAPDEDPTDIVEPIAVAEADLAPRTMTVAEAAQPRPGGEVTTTTAGQPAGGSFVAPLRESDVADALSTVDDLQESFGRIALVFAVAEQRDSDRVGHYGTGTGATAPFPTVPAS